MFEEVLDTKIKSRIAKLFAERRETLQISDVARILNISKSRASECLKDLAEKGILESEAIGRSVVYKPAKSNLAQNLFKALTHEKFMLLEIEKNLVSEMRKTRPDSIILFGSTLKGLKIGSDIDFLVIYKNKIGKERIYEISSKLSEKSGFHISVLTMSSDEFITKARRGEEFVLNVMANYRLLYGKKPEEIVW